MVVLCGSFCIQKSGLFLGRKGLAFFFCISFFLTFGHCPPVREIVDDFVVQQNF
jgi:hypothetical protein